MALDDNTPRHGNYAILRALEEQPSKSLEVQTEVSPSPASQSQQLNNPGPGYVSQSTTAARNHQILNGGKQLSAPDAPGVPKDQDTAKFLNTAENEQTTERRIEAKIKEAALDQKNKEAMNPNVSDRETEKKAALKEAGTEFAPKETPDRQSPEQQRNPNERF